MSVTPGPWSVGEGGTSMVVWSDSSVGALAVAEARRSLDDARLLAAAPDLLIACEMFVEFVAGIRSDKQYLNNRSLSCKCCANVPQNCRCVGCAMKYAIAKAKGEAV